MANSTISVTQSGYVGQILVRMAGFLFFVLLPGFLTAVAPVSWVQFHRDGERVVAHAKVCMFFIIPYRTHMVDPVTSVADGTHATSVTTYRRSGANNDKKVTSEKEGFLDITGPNGTARVSVTPHNLADVKKKAEAFLNDPQAKELKLFIVANWKFGVIAGGFVSLFTLLYVVSYTIAGAVWLLPKLGLITPAQAARLKAYTAQQGGSTRSSRLP